MSVYGEDTKDFLKGKHVYGGEYVYRLLKPLQPGDQLPEFSGTVFHRGRESDINIDQLKGNALLLIFIPNTLDNHGKASWNLVIDLCLNKGLDLDIVAITSNSLDTMRAWMRLKANPALRRAYIIPDHCGHIVKKFGLLNPDTCETYSGFFVSDVDGCIQGSSISSKVCGIYPFSAEEAIEFVETSLTPADDTSSEA